MFQLVSCQVQLVQYVEYKRVWGLGSGQLCIWWHYYTTEWSKKACPEDPKFLCHLNRELDRDTNCKTVTTLFIFLVIRGLNSGPHPS
jgi:hypothetical protein